MRHSRRSFLKSAAASASFAAFPHSASRLFADDSLQSKLAADPLRPQFHLLPAKNWMNDPNGPIYWNGLYHMFFQYNPNAAVWGDMHWNHAVSEDMIHWRHMPIALAPTPGWADADGCFTGSAVNDNGIATIVYTGVKKTPFEQATLRDNHNNFRETQCLATSRDPKLLKWEKRKDPVIQPPNDPKLTGFRDPFLWRDESAKLWYLGVASGQSKVGGRVLLYRSKDLRSWEYLHPLATGHWTEKENTNPVDSGEMWECPDFFPLGKKHVLLYSTAGQVVWEVGELDSKELLFHPQKRGVLDHGSYYAQKTQLDAKGNRILWGWITERRPDSELIAAGWAGCMALPRVLTLGPEDELEMRFAPQVEKLRQAPRHLKSGHLVYPDGGVDVQTIGLENLSFELAWSSDNKPWSLSLVSSGTPWLIASSTPADSNARFSLNGATMEIPVDSAKNGRFNFRLIVDGSVVELFCNHREVMTLRIYRTPTGPLSVRPLAPEDANFVAGEAWQMKPISKDRLTT
ncbi:MAG TPA: glycoside hydrolase family 32 protein [Candidatus Acidoferrum sp.]|nr:glycoside hydrolase family 32 protein [Candidatus Acidoferrum sp.]